MSNEDIIKEIDEATDLMRETKKKVNEALNKARAVVNRGQPRVSEDTLEMERMKALNEGRNEVWELAKKIAVEPENGGYDSVQLYDIFGFSDMDLVFTRYSPQGALAKLDAYEKEQEEKRKAEEMAVINVGDVVEYDGVQAVVMDIDSVDNVALFTENACIESWLPQCVCKKTGKRIDIQSMLEQIGE